MNPDAVSLLSPEQAAKYEFLRRRLHALYRRDQFAIHDKVVEWHIELRGKYPNAREYLMFHLISGSTAPNFTGLFDFPPADSVEHFINTEYAEGFLSANALKLQLSETGV